MGQSPKARNLPLAGGYVKCNVAEGKSEQLTVREMRFVHLCIRGEPYTQAYEKAGYRPHRSNPWRLSVRERVRRHLDLARRKAANRMAITLESLLDELEEARVLAKSAEQASAAVAATMGKAKLAGFVTDKAEVKHDIPKDNATLRAQLAEDLAALGHIEAAQTILNPKRDFGLEDLQPEGDIN